MKLRVDATSKSEVPRKKIIKILLDCGSDGDLLFQKKEQPNTSSTRLGRCQNDGAHEVQVKFFEYSNSKVFLATPDIVEYDGKTMGKPAFDLILGTKTLKELGIILDFKKQMITIDEIELPTHNIEDMPSSKGKDLALHNSLARSQEPKSTEEATKCVVQILDANYKKADLQAVVMDNCSHLSSKDKA